MPHLTDGEIKQRENSSYSRLLSAVLILTEPQSRFQHGAKHQKKLETIYGYADIKWRSKRICGEVKAQP